MGLTLTKNDFNLLQLHQKALMLDKAAFLMCLPEDDASYLLYSYYSYYIEVSIDNATNDIMGIEAFSDLGRLDKYLEHVPSMESL